MRYIVYLSIDYYASVLFGGNASLFSLFMSEKIFHFGQWGHVPKSLRGAVIALWYPLPQGDLRNSEFKNLMGAAGDLGNSDIDKIWNCGR